MLEDVMADSVAKVAQFSISRNGTLVYAAGGQRDRCRFVWIERDGSLRQLALPVQTYGEFQLSPDGRHISEPRCRQQE